VAGALAVLVALVANGFTTALIVLAIIIVVQQIEGNVLQPVLQSKSMNLHAAVVLLSVTAGASIFGIIGAFLAVPAAAVAAVLFRYLNEQMALRSDEDSGIDDDIAEKLREDLGAEEPAKTDNS
ncbi:MAG: putative PurR-regulated permease PerM, partial [Rhodococcus sp. (in: high G+C Gram-positive bacteria)]